MQWKVKYTHSPELNKCSFIFDHVKIYWNEQMTLHEQKTWELSYIITGSGTRTIGDTIERFSSNEVVLIPPDLPHCWSFDELSADRNGQIENVTITFSNEFLRNCSLIFPEIKTYIVDIMQNKEGISYKGDKLIRLQKLFKSMIGQSEIERISSFFQILSLIAFSDNSISIGNQIREEDKKTKRIQKILLYLMNNYQSTITLTEMAKLVHLDKSSFCIFFKKMTGKTFFTYLTEYRIDSSCQMITKTTMTIAEICYASGFKDIPYYNRTFKKMKNYTPSEYRRIAKS